MWGGKSGVLEHKSGNISETRKDRGKVTMEWPIGTHQRSFERYHPRPPTASSSPRLGFATPIQNSNRYYVRNGWSYGLPNQIGRNIHRVYPNKSGLKTSLGVSRDCPVSKISNLRGPDPPTSQTDRHTDGQKTCDRKTALCIKVHRALKRRPIETADPRFNYNIDTLACALMQGNCSKA